MLKRTLFALLIVTVCAVDLTCEFKYKTNWWAIDNLYFCEQTEDVEVTESDVIELVRDHIGKYANRNVRGFRVSEKKFEYIPAGMENFFGSLEFLAFWSTGLKEIRGSDLAPLTELRVLSVWDNAIEVLENNLLKMNTQLEYIGLGRNRIAFVDGKVFNHLKKLHTLHFDGNRCMSRQVQNDIHEVWDMVEEIEEKCSDCTKTNDVRYICQGLTDGVEAK